MSEYIRKDDVLALLEKYRIELPSTYSAGLTTAKNAVKGMPTEDVLPRTEVAREIFTQLEEERDYYKKKYDMLRKALLDVDVVGEVRQNMRRMEERIIELKKKLVE